MKLNTHSSTPLYIQLKQTLTEDINKGVYSPGEKLPIETDLCDIYGVSRITVRKAILDLVEDGLLTRQQGKGTFVQYPKAKRELFAVNGHAEYMSEMGKAPKTKMLSFGLKAAKANIADILSISPESDILELQRILFYDDQPLTLEISHYSLELLPKLNEYVHNSVSMYETIKKHYNVTPVHNKKLLNMVFANADEAKHLNCEVGEPLFKVEKVAYDAQKRPIHSSFLYYPANRVTFTIDSSMSNE
ncbi:GntR family transcriptional regulator [Priestia filamentosa]|uniref:GntR family transcriptional regulator n=1 Tax=Priestia filamentosa TaxID=1402861 RepID=A0A1X7EKU7_9BACI|nr:GntR family transcriptional regulator [Priestia filamentosa]AKO93076.1 GntR family transcriptional regulator [Priestia filamentosa]MDT3763201.1 GntR family transcriptional regulator [Priestia filamentosa]OXS69709.1 GntR family transcriptional regulator [Priestia filamentosa]RJS63630.1 GntR family transcriptional regulator [Priestia filamentosa]WRU93675.1 GntR family transcriptional regulator [Priestia filamentosa]